MSESRKVNDGENFKLPRMPSLAHGLLVASNHPKLDEPSASKEWNADSNECETAAGASRKQSLKAFSDIANEFKNHSEKSDREAESPNGENTDDNDTKSSPPPLIPPPNREFTFTGYDIMSDDNKDQRQPPKAISEVEPGTTSTEDLTEEKITKKYKVKYEDACYRFGVHAIGSITRKLEEPELSVRHRSLGAGGAKAVAVALIKNRCVQSLNLEYTNVETEGVAAICEMLDVNFTITELNLTGNNIEGEGMRILSDALTNQQFLLKLNVSDNGLKDQDAEYLADILANNYILIELIASHNEFGENGGDAIGAALVMNDTLQVLDLSWNHIRGPGAIAIAEGLQRNGAITHLNLSWNGFGLDGAEAIAIALTKNTSLTHLDLTCNRLHGEAIGALLKGYRLNGSLITLKLAKNPFQPQIATIILRIITKHSQSKLEFLDLTDIVVDDEFYDSLEKLKFIRNITVLHGPLIKKRELRKHAKNGIVDIDPRKVLFDFMAKEGMRVVDLFKRLDTDGSNSVSRDEFKAGLIGVDAPLTSSQLDDLITVLDTDGDGEVDLAELSNGEKIYRRQMLAKKLKQKKLKEQQDKQQKEAEKSRFKKKF